MPVMLAYLHSSVEGEATTAMISIIISIVALIVSGIVAWKNYLSPLRLSVYSGSPRLEPCPLKLIGGGEVIRFAVVLPLYFVNRGAQDGIIRDIILIVNSGQSAWLFYPGFYCKYSVSTEATLGKRLTEDPSNEPFYPIHLQGKETLYKPIVFFPVGDNKKFPLGDAPLLPGKYTFQVKTLDAKKKDYELKCTFHVTLNEKTTREFASSASPTCFIPFIDEVQDKRQTL